MANTFTYKKVKYTILANNELRVAENKKFIGPLVIPETIEKNGITYNVTEIEYGAFSGSGITSVEIPKSIKTIPGFAFSFTPLESVTLNEGVIEIGGFAFSNCKFTTIYIPKSVTTIREKAFLDCDCLDDITFAEQSNICTVDESPFKGTKWLSKELSQSDNLIIGNILVCVNTEDKLYYVPEGITSISTGAFFKCHSLEKVVLPSSLKKLSGAFKDCRSLKEVLLPKGIEEIGSACFSHCSSLKSILLPETVTIIGEKAFSGCTALTELNIPANVTRVGQGVFSGCTSLTELNLSDGITELPRYFCEGCISLRRVLLPERLIKIGDYAFHSCPRLSSITLPDSLKEIHSDAFLGCYDLDGIVLPDGLMVIKRGAFGCCNSIKSINIPNSVKVLENDAFWSCYSLREVNLPDGKEINKAVFSNCPNIGKKMPKNTPSSTTISILSDPFFCECFNNLSEEDIQPYLSDKYSSPSDTVAEDSTNAYFVKWGRYREVSIDDKDIPFDNLFYRPMYFYYTKWENDRHGELDNLLSDLKEGCYCIIDRRNMYKSRMTFHIELNGAPFNKNCLTLIRIKSGDPWGEIVPSSSMCENRLLYCGTEIYGDFEYDMGSQGELERFVLYKNLDGSIKTVGRYTY